MQNIAKPQSSFDSSFVGLGLGFVAVVGVAIGAVCFMHGKYIDRQMELYAEYKSRNAWRVPARKSYDRLSSLMTETSKVNPAQQQDRRYLDGLSKMVDAECTRLALLTSGVRPPFGNAQQDASELSSLCRNRIAALFDSCHVPHTPFEERRLRADVSRNLCYTLSVNYASLTYDQRVKVAKQAERIVAGYNIEKVEDMRALGLGYWAPNIEPSLRNFERDMNARPYVPDGLDLKFVEQLR